MKKMLWHLNYVGPKQMTDKQKTLEERVARLESKNASLVNDTNQILAVVFIWLVLLTIF